MSKEHMRRDVVKLVAGLGLVGLAGCLGGDDTVDADVPSTSAPTATPTPTPTPTEQTETPAEPDADPAAVAAWAQAHGDAGKTGTTADSGPTEGAVRWESVPGGAIETPPVAVGDRLFVTSRKKLYALRRADGSTLWSRTFGATIAHAVAYADGMVLVPSERLEAVSVETGDTKWTSAVGRGPVTDLTVHDGVVYFGAKDSKMYGLAIADGKQVAQSALFSFGDLQSPATDGTYVYVAAASSVVGLKPSGSQIWKYETESAVYAPPMVYGETVYVGTGNGDLHALDRRTGKAKWTATLGGAVSAPPTMGDTGLFVVSGSTVYRVEPGTGRVEWQERVTDSPLTAPVHAADTLFVGSSGHRVYALNPTNGAVRWSKNTGHPVVGCPAVVDDTLYVATSGGVVTAFE